MSIQTPKLDRRSSRDIVKQVFDRLNAEDLEQKWGAEPGGPLGSSLIHVFARYCELIIERLNQAPDKSYLAFLNYLGVSRIPPAPAKAPLTFTPVKQAPLSRTPLLVPAGTQAAGPPGEGEGEPVIFETTSPLELVNAELLRVIAFDPQTDCYADRSGLATAAGSPGEPAFEGDQPAVHAFYLTHGDIFGAAGITELRLRIDIDNPAEHEPMGVEYQWFIPAPQGEILLQPAADTTCRLSRSGLVVFKDLPPWPESEWFGRTNRWLACRLLTPLKTERGRPLQRLPRIGRIALWARWRLADAPVKQAFYNTAPLDIGKDFFPLGERPRFGDVFYLESKAFASAEALTTLQIKLTNPASAAEKIPLPPVYHQGKPRIRWETWDGTRWASLECLDGTLAFRKDGTIAFTKPIAAMPTQVNGQDGVFIRGRLMSGHYGEDERLELINPEQPMQGLRHSPATLSPPAIQSLTVTSEGERGYEPPEALITHNPFKVEAVDLSRSEGFLPFTPADCTAPALYLGFQASNQEALAGRRLNLYFQLADATGRRIDRGERAQRASPLLAQYWSGRRWSDCGGLLDETAGFSASNTVSFRIGQDPTTLPTASFDPSLYWIRLMMEEPRDFRSPVLRRIAVNTVLATHSLTLENELLGSGSGRPRQSFHTARVPVLGDVQLEVREPDLPVGEEAERIRREEGEDAITVVKDAKGAVQEVWVRWRAVDDFLSSGPEDRHYVIDRQTGELCFGDGARGRIPPPGPNNLRLRRYRTGGGASGNQPPGSITQLRSSVPFVETVANPEPATGGVDMEDWRLVKKRGSRWLRHRGRAVTAEDYEDLAEQASPAVARAQCYPLRDLQQDPNAERLWPGIVSLVIVPRSAESCPRPSTELMEQVRRFLDARRASDIDLVLLGPDYVRIDVEAEIMPGRTPIGVDWLAECERRLAGFLHPSTGGAEGRGWRFGALPKPSDFYALLEEAPGVEYVRSLQIRRREERPGSIPSGIFLIGSGRHTIRSGW